MGKLFDTLRKMEIYDRSLIIVTSDHGELFDEHGLSNHGKLLYEGAVKVPLLIKLPNSTRVGREPGLISSADLFSTILSIVGFPLPAGTSGQAFGGELLVSEIYRRDYGTDAHRALFRDGYKYMWFANDTPHELYDLVDDPSEEANLISQEPEIASALEADLRKWEIAHQPRSNEQPERSEQSQDEMMENLMQNTNLVFIIFTKILM